MPKGKAAEQVTALEAQLAEAKANQAARAEATAAYRTRHEQAAVRQFSEPGDESDAELEAARGLVRESDIAESEAVAIVGHIEAQLADARLAARLEQADEDLARLERLNADLAAQSSKIDELTAELVDALDERRDASRRRVALGLRLGVGMAAMEAAERRVPSVLGMALGGYVADRPNGPARSQFEGGLAGLDADQARLVLEDARRKRDRLASSPIKREAPQTA